MLTAILYIRRMLLKKLKITTDPRYDSHPRIFGFVLRGGGGEGSGKGVTQSKKQDGKYSKVYLNQTRPNYGDRMAFREGNV